VTALGDGTFRVEAIVTNVGYLPTSITDRGVVGRERPDGTLDRQVVRPPAVMLVAEAAGIVDGPARRRIPHLAGSNPFLEAVTESSRTVSWVVRPTGNEATVRVIARSDKAGVVQSARVRIP